MAPLRYAAKFDPFLSLDCAPTPSTLAQSKERKGSNFAIWQPCRKAALGDPHDVSLVCRVNGQVRQEGNTKDMVRLNLCTHMGPEMRRTLHGMTHSQKQTSVPF